MKRCVNCGFNNQDETVRCIKCNYPLAAVSSEKESGNPPLDSPPTPTKGSSVQKTKAGIKIHTPAWDEPVTPSPSSTSTNCPQCGYLVRPGESECVKCGADLKAATAAPPVNPAPESPGDPLPNAPLKTVKRIVPRPKQGCRLIGLSLDDERELNSIPLKGDNIVLNRETLDKNNDSISRSGHAKLAFKDGEWLLDNLTSLKSTFIQVNGPVALKDGDVILIGDRLFKFKVD